MSKQELIIYHLAHLPNLFLKNHYLTRSTSFGDNNVGVTFKEMGLISL